MMERKKRKNERAANIRGKRKEMDKNREKGDDRRGGFKYRKCEQKKTKVKQKRGVRRK